MKYSIFYFGLLFGISATAMAGDQTGQVLEVRVTSKSLGNNHTHIRLSGTYNAQPSCIDPNWRFWVVDTDTASGKSILSTVLTAQATGKNITFWGSGSCHLDAPGPNGMEKIIQVGIQ